MKVGSKTIPVGVAVTLPTVAEVLFAGTVPPRSTSSRTPRGDPPARSCSAVTTANPRLLVPRSGSMATAMGDWSTPMEVAVSDVAAPEPNSSARSSSDTVLVPVLVISAAPVPSSIATPVGLDPTVTAATFCVPVVRSMTEAVPSVLLATTAKPYRGLTATPSGSVPVAMVDRIEPKVALDGLMSTTEMLPQPLLETTTMGEKPWPGNWSAMATELGDGLALEHAVFKSTALMTKKSVTLERDPPLLTTSTA